MNDDSRDVSEALERIEAHFRGHIDVRRDEAESSLCRIRDRISELEQERDALREAAVPGKGTLRAWVDEYESAPDVGNYYGTIVDFIHDQMVRRISRLRSALDRDEGRGEDRLDVDPKDILGPLDALLTYAKAPDAALDDDVAKGYADRLRKAVYPSSPVHAEDREGDAGEYEASASDAVGRVRLCRALDIDPGRGPEEVWHEIERKASNLLDFRNHATPEDRRGGEPRIIDTPTPDGCPGIVVEFDAGLSVVHPPGAGCEVHDRPDRRGGEGRRHRTASEVVNERLREFLRDRVEHHRNMADIVAGEPLRSDHLELADAYEHRLRDRLTDEGGREGDDDE